MFHVLGLMFRPLVKVFSATLFIMLLVLYRQDVFAQQPEYPNNKVGIHLNQPEDQDIQAASDLVNSGGGDWGYVTFVVRDEDRDVTKINDVFNKFRKQHLIPLVRLATGACGNAWCRPNLSQAGEWADFLSSLSWPTQNKHVILFNEPNQGKEWGGQVDPSNYAEVANAFCQALKVRDDEFLIMLAGFDAAAPQRPPDFYDEAIFLQEMYGFKPEVFDCIDGWASHSYPSRGYISSPYKRGRNSVKTYEWELAQVRGLGVDKDYCVYITETGWPHREGFSENASFHSADIVAGYFGDYFRLMQEDDRVCAATPFIINSQSELFDHFSWRLSGGEGFYPQYEVVRALEKKTGAPPQKQLINIQASLPKQLTVNSRYTFALNITNGGQAWWDSSDGYALGLLEGDIGSSFSTITDMQPGNKQSLEFAAATGGELGSSCAKVGFYKGEQVLMELFQWCYELFPQPSLEFQVGRLIKTAGDNFQVQFFDSQENLVYSQSSISAPEGAGYVSDIENVVIGECYRVVLLKDYHLPRQIDCVVLQSGVNNVSFEAMIPIDFDNDGKFTLKDITSLRKSRSR